MTQTEESERKLKLSQQDLLNEIYSDSSKKKGDLI